MSGLVIVGTGHAGLTLAREWRKRDPETPLTLVTADDGAAYYKPNLSKSLSGGKTADDLITADAAKLQADYSATVRAGVRLISIDRAAQTIRLSDGSELAYGQLVLANGASCRVLPIAGDAAEQILHVNDRLDYARFRQALPAGGKVVLLGAGLIGCEYANDLLASGHQVELVDPLAWPLGTLLPEPVGQDLQAALAAAGAQWHLGRTVASVDTADKGYAVRLSDGQTLEADLVLSAVGLVPNTAVAQEAGLDCGRGIRVDAQMRTADPKIFALGDVAEVCGHVLPYILPITNSARALAATLAAEPTAVQWPAMPVIIKTPVLPTIVCPPPVGAEGSWAISGDAAGRVARFEGAQGQLLGFALTGTAVKERGALASQTQAPVLA
ncbi:MAG: NAD(P)/FAD-dependent oxidoreductase [Oceanococcaceae bacterium]